MGKIYESRFVRSRNFEWLKIRDTNNYYTRIYDKQFTTLRKFVATLPPIGTDSAHKDFFKALCDTFNAYKFYTLNYLYYNDPHLYDVSSGDHLLKRRLVGSNLWKLYRDILNDNSIFYYKVNVQDRRYGEHSVFYRGHYAYEAELIVVPSGNSYLYFMPRYNGLKYHLNELPFYYEGVLAVLEPRNFQDDMKGKQDAFHKFLKTHKGTYNENTRTENGTVKVSLDSLKAGFTIKESLSGQFSTVLRHLYLKDHIDPP